MGFVVRIVDRPCGPDVGSALWALWSRFWIGPVVQILVCVTVAARTNSARKAELRPEALLCNIEYIGSIPTVCAALPGPSQFVKRCVSKVGMGTKARFSELHELNTQTHVASQLHCTCAATSSRCVRIHVCRSFNGIGLRSQSAREHVHQIYWYPSVLHRNIVASGT